MFVTFIPPNYILLGSQGYALVIVSSGSGFQGMFGPLFQPQGLSAS